MDTMKNTSGLIRMIVVDTTLFPGRVEELPLDDHTVILAENGSGKTSMAKLVPVFWGGNMSEVVDSAEREKFIGFFLPRESSYIAFEYRNQHGDIRSVVIHSDPQNEKIQYRFIRDSLTADMFSATDTDGKTSFVKTQSFEGRLRELKIAHAPALVTTTVAFRGIIQGRIDEGTDGRDRAGHRQLADEYGLSNVKAPLTGIHKILIQLLNNNVSMKNLLGVVARQSSESGVDEFHLLGKGRADHVARWPAQFKAYEKVMGAEPQARELNALKMQIDGSRSEISDRFNTLMAFEAEFEARIIILQEEINSLKEAGNLQEDSFEKRIRELKDMIEDHGSKINALILSIGRLTDRDERLKSKGAQSAADKIAEIPALEGELDNAKSLQRALKSKGADISLNFDKLRQDLHVTNSGILQDLQSVADERIAVIEERVEADRLASYALSQKTRSETTTGIDALDSDIEKLNQDLLSKHSEKAAVAADAITQDRVSNMKSNMNVMATRLEDYEKQGREATSKLQSAKHRLEIADRTQADAERRLSEARAAHAKVIEELQPKEGSLLSFLRRNNPSWGDTIGKVIHPDLLQRTGLSPDMLEGDASSIFGLVIDIDKIDVPDHADTDILEQHMEDAGAILTVAELDRNSKSEEHEGAARAYQAAVKRQGLCEAKIGIARENHHDAVNSYDLAIEAFDAHMAVKKADILADIERIAALMGQAKLRKSELEASLAARLAEIDASLEKVISEGQSERNAVRAGLAQKQDKAKTSYDTALEKAGIDETAALSSVGVDESAVAAGEATISELTSKIQQTRSLRALAEEWEAHMAAMANMKDFVGEKDNLTFKKNDLEVNLKNLTSEFEAAREFVKKNVKTAQDDLDLTRENLSAVKAQLANCPAWITPTAVKGDTFIEGHEANLARTVKLMMRINQDSRSAVSLVARIAKTFRHCGDTGISAYLNTEDLGDHSFEWADTIMKWYDGDHQEYRDVLMNGINMAVQPILSAFHDLKEAESGIRRVNRKLGAAIQSNVGFPHVKDIQISIRTRIQDLPYWGDLVAFQAAHSAWRADRAAQPSKDLIDTLKAFLNHWTEGSEPTVRLEDVIYLDGSITERGNVRKFGKNTDLSNLSSNGNIIVVRQILFTALLTVMRRGSEVKMVWAVDEVGALDFKNTDSLLKMLTANGIALLTAAPTLDRQVRDLFKNQMRIRDKCLFRIGDGVKSRMREWISDSELTWPENLDHVDEVTINQEDQA